MLLQVCQNFQYYEPDLSSFECIDYVDLQVLGIDDVGYKFHDNIYHLMVEFRGMNGTLLEL